MKNIIAELDRIAKYIEDIDEPWSHLISYRIDNVSQQIEEKAGESNKYSKISKNVLEQYREDLEFLSSKESSLKEMIVKQNTKNADAVYKVLKNQFGNLNKKDSLRFIKSVINNKNKNI